MNNIREHIYLAALLHDIGKFYQRADAGSVKNSKFLSDYCKDESTFCPLNNGQYSHKHVLWTAQFIEDFSIVFKKLTSEDMQLKDSLMHLAAGHHLSNDQLSTLGRIIKKADCLSSGMDRDSVDAIKDDTDSTNWDSFKKKPMTSILETIGLTDHELSNKTKWHHQPAIPMVLDKSYFATTDSIEPDYQLLWNKFISEFKFIQANTYHAFAETLLNLLYKYTSSVPSSTINFPDVSLYDHLKTTAAIATCLYDYQESGDKNAHPFILIGADFSGIQPYIYQIVSKHAGKNLKGRSFYLRILSDSIVRYLLKELNLFQANIIYNSGGGFYLLAPNTTRVKQKLTDAIATIEKKLFQMHGTSLFVAIDFIELSEDALLHKNEESLGKSWGELFLKRDRKKNTKFSSLIDYKTFFEPSHQGGECPIDKITGEEIPKNEKEYNIDGIGTIREITKKQIDLGKSLRDADVMVISENQIPYWNNKTSVQPIGLSFWYYFVNLSDLEEKKTELKSSADKVSVITLNGKKGNCDFMQTINGIDNIYGLEFYGGNEMDSRDIPTFEEMCENAESEGDFKRLGVLRMDVDNLGSIFQSGILPHRATLSRYAALSRSFDYFFSGYLNTIWRETAPEQLFIIYSGGDDVFIVGAWDKTIDCAHRIKDDFREFTCNNTNFSISGGIAIVSPKFPIMKGAEMSADEEHNAKTHSCNKQDKNSISFMNYALNWYNEFEIVKQLKDTIVRLSDANNKNTLPKSFIGKVLQHHAMSQIKNHKIKNFKTFWMITYDLCRMKERIKDNEAKELIENCKNEICSNGETINGNPIKTDYHPIELWALACRWAELEMRS